jgi:hypothetical protein
MQVLARPARHGVSAAWAEIKAAVARGVERSMDARMNQVRREIETYRVRRGRPRGDGVRTTR